MDLGLSLQEIAAKYQLDAAARAQLRGLSGLDDEPPNVARVMRAGLAILAAALFGLGIIFWVAANWDSLGRTGRFVLLQGVVVVMCIGAYVQPRLRVPLGLLALISFGGLFAYFGQTYQTGADPWQLFAVWAVLGLPLCLGVRHDALWSLWALVAMSGVSLWLQANTGHRWRMRPDDIQYQIVACVATVALTALLSPLFSRWTGAGAWSLRLCVTLAAMSMTFIGVVGLLGNGLSYHYWLALLMLGLCAAAFAQRRLFDVFALSAVGLGLNILLVGLLARVLFSGNSSDGILGLLMLGLIAAGLLAATVSGILHLSRSEVVSGGEQ